MGVFEDLCSSEGKSKDLMIAAMFEEYGDVLRMTKGYLQVELESFTQWVKDNRGGDPALVNELMNRAVKANVLGVVMVFLYKMAAFGLSETDVVEALSSCCDDQGVFTALSSIMSAGGIKVYSRLLGKRSD